MLTRVHRVSALRLAIGLALLATAAQAKPLEYVSWKGGFHITVPEGWVQIDYYTADVFLASNQAGQEILDYEAVFADSTVIPFFAGQYFILTVDTIPGMTQQQVDSSLEVLRKVFNADFTYFPVADLMANLKSNSPSYDADQKLATVYSIIEQPGNVIRKSLLLVKFYENGIASFYFYSPDSLFEAGVEKMRQTVASLSTKNLDEAAQAGKPIVSDAKPAATSDRIKRTFPWAILIALFVVIIAARHRRRQREQTPKSE